MKNNLVMPVPENNFILLLPGELTLEEPTYPLQDRVLNE